MIHPGSKNQPPEAPTKAPLDEEPGLTSDAVFGMIHEDGPNYRNVRITKPIGDGRQRLTLQLRWGGSARQSS